MYLEEDLSKYNFKAIIGVGQDVLARFFPGAQVSEIYGLPFVVDIAGRKYWYLPVFDTIRLLDTDMYPNPDYASFYTTLKADLRKFFNNVDRLGKPTMDSITPDAVIIPKTKNEARELVKGMSEPIGFDTEATGLYPYVHRARMLTAAFK